MRIRALAAATGVVAALVGPTIVDAAPASGDGWKTVRHAGAAVTVPAAWLVVDLASDPTRCLRLDVHAVYLGAPGPDASCPSHAIGRTESVQILSAAEADVVGERTPDALRTSVGSERLATNVTATDGRIVRIAFAEPSPTTDRIEASVAFAAAPPEDPIPTPVPDDAAGPTAAATRALAQRSAGTTQDGFDACEAPSSSAMATWAATSPYSAVGVYIGGVNRACTQANLTAAWVRTQQAAGWSLIPTYVGRQAPCTPNSWAKITPSQAATQGVTAAKDAVTLSGALGMGKGTPIYLDIEAFDLEASCTSAVTTYISAWTGELHRRGYVSGVYSSAASGIVAMARLDGSPSFQRPDDVWIARWNGVRSDAEPLLTATQWADHRIHQYRGDHTETYGGVRIAIDSNFVNGSVARSTTGAVPPEGNVLLDPSWEDPDDTTSWVPVPEDPAELVRTVGPGAHEGASWAQVTAPTDGGTGIRQDVAVGTHAGERWTATAWVRSTTGAPVAGQLTLAGLGGSAGAGGGTSFTAGADWTQVSVSFDAYATYSGLRVELDLTTRDASLDVDDASLVGSPAFAPFAAWEGFVSQQLADFTGNPGPLTTRDAAVAQLAAGALTPTAYVQRLVRGSWFAPHLAPVARLYWAYFGRIPDHHGALYWAAKHRAGTRLVAISQQFATSTEFQRTYGTLSDRDFVGRIYTDVLGRPADPSGLSYWTGRLTSRSMTRGQVMVQFSESAENLRRTAARTNTFLVVTGMLQRSPSQAELDTGAALPTYLVIDGIRRGPEYLARVG